jgi:HPt (histidine-containing phosphotransfer) domain-containing protein
MHASTLTTVTSRYSMRPPIDYTSFRENWSVDPHENRDLLIDYAESNAADLQSLRAGVAGNRMLDVMRAAHRIAGASQIVGALRVVAACRRIENAVRDNQWGAIQDYADALSREIEQVDDFIHSI